MNSHQMAYFAGLVDGEGSFGIYETTPGSYLATIQISMTDLVLIEWIHNEFGGSISSKAATDSREEQLHWCISNRTTLAVLVSELLPYLRTKNLSAQIILDFCRKFPGNQGGRYSKEDKLLMMNYKQLSALANSKGPGSNKIKAVLVSAGKEIDNAKCS